jgi:hypothetical protein
MFQPEDLGVSEVAVWLSNFAGCSVKALARSTRFHCVEIGGEREVAHAEGSENCIIATAG